MSERTAKVSRSIRQKRQMCILEDLIQGYLDKLEWEHPHHRSPAFINNTAAKWTCKELLHEIHHTIKELPFEITPVELLDQFSEKMKRYACDHKNMEHSYLFVKAAETAEYLIEEYFHTAQ